MGGEGPHIGRMAGRSQRQQSVMVGVQATARRSQTYDGKHLGFTHNRFITHEIDHRVQSIGLGRHHFRQRNRFVYVPICLLTIGNGPPFRPRRKAIEFGSRNTP